MFTAHTPPALPMRQRGLTLVELMVGVVIGLMVVLVAMGGMMVSRQVSGSVSDVSNLQQQAAYAFRVLGHQIRSAGGLHLKVAPEGNLAWLSYDRGFDIRTDTLSGSDALDTYKLSVAHFSEAEPLYAGVSDHLLRDCLGQKPADGKGLLKSQFRLTNNELHCAGDETKPQPIIGNVADFQVRYLLQDGSLSKLGYRYATGVTDWSQVVAVEVCLVLYGTESVKGLPEESQTYVGCPDGGNPAPSLRMTHASLPAARNGRLHMAFRNIYQLRSHGIQCAANLGHCD